MKKSSTDRKNDLELTRDPYPSAQEEVRFPSFWEKNDLELTRDPYPSAQEEVRFPSFWDGFLYFFGLIGNPHTQSMEVFRQRNRVSSDVYKVLSDEEAMKVDQKALQGDWEQVGKYLQFAVKKLQEQHPELKERAPND